MRFSDIVGNKSTAEALRRLADTDRIPHALLLSGPSGIGKLMLARAFVQYVHCPNRSGGEPCGVCPSCLQHQTLGHPDLSFIFPTINKKSEGKKLSEDYAREWNTFLQDSPWASPEYWHSLLDIGNSQPIIYEAEADVIIRQMSLSASSSRYRFMIIWLPERLHPSAANKLLKIIEEPASDTIFVMVSNEPQLILPTIFSRMQRLPMLPLSEEEIADELRRNSISDEEARNAARLAGGSMYRAMEIVANATEDESFRTLFEGMMRMAYAVKLPELKRLSEEMAALERTKARRFLDYCLRMVRENFIYNLQVPSLLTQTPQEEAFSSRFAPFLHAGNVEGIADCLSRARSDIERNANIKIVSFDMMLQLMVLIRKPRQ